jgi:hypothetical protein
MIEDGRALALTVALKHLMERLEKKGTLLFGERETMLDDIYHELDYTPALEAGSEQYYDARRTIGALRNPAIRASTD